MDEYFKGISVKKQLIFDVLEPDIPTELVEVGYETRFKIKRFGSFELGDREYIFGTEEAQYMSSFNSKTDRFPIVIAEVHNHYGEDPYFLLEPIGNFSRTDRELIESAIEYALDSQRVATRYYPACYG